MNQDILNLIFNFLWYSDINNCKLVNLEWDKSIRQHNFQYKRIIIQQFKQIFDFKKDTNFKFINNYPIQNWFFFLNKLPSDFFNLEYLQTVQNLVEIEDNKIYFKGSYIGADRIVFLDKEVPNLSYNNKFIFPVLNKNTYDLFLSNVYYFEIKVSNDNFRESWNDECIGIGFTNRKINKSCIGYQVGWTYDSFGYHSDDGKIFLEGIPINQVEKWGPGDVIGAGIIYHKKYFEIFYTKNGKLVSNQTAKNTKLEYYSLTPAISIDTSYCIEVNWGQNEFKFPISNMILDHYYKISNKNLNNNFKELNTHKIFKKNVIYKDEDEILDEITSNIVGEMLINSIMNNYLSYN